MQTIQIIAEIGINHNGSYDEAMKLIRAAAESGVHAIKFQYRNVENAYSSSNEIGDEMLLAEIRKTHIDVEQILNLKREAEALSLDVGISFFDANDMDDFGDSLRDFAFMKVPSAELCNQSLLDAMFATGLHVYISTGCHGEDEIEAVLSTLPADGWTPLHCISNYPTALSNSRLGYIEHMLRKWQRPVGYSSHDDYWEACLLAVQLGATVIERHITMDRAADGLDHTTSSTPDEFARMSQFFDNFGLMMAGDAPRVANQGELMNRQNLGRSYFASEDMAIGECVSLDKLVYRSPNTGINAKNIDQFVNKPLKAPIAKDQSLTPSLFSNAYQLPEKVLAFARDNHLSLPVRLFDFDKFSTKFPIGCFEFHLSFGEVKSDIDIKQFAADNRYSIHLPDYIDPTHLMDPFAADDYERRESRLILDRTINFADALQQRTGHRVPVVGSFSVTHNNIEQFYENHAALVKECSEKGVELMPQWLPPIAWYFGGSVRLDVWNDQKDADYISRHDIPVCMDFCHLLLGKNYSHFDANKLLDQLSANIGHIHIADAMGIDGEGLAFGEGESENVGIIGTAFDNDCMKVIEVWQGHLDDGAGFAHALEALERLYG